MSACAVAVPLAKYAGAHRRLRAISAELDEITTRARERAQEADMLRFGLDEVAGVRTGNFSQGMRQRLALGRCLMRDPDIVLLDEPYAGLDVDARVLVDDLLTEAGARARTVVIASHEPPPAGSVSRRVILEAGRIVAGEPVPG